MEESQKVEQLLASPKIARAQAMEFAFGLSHHEMSVLMPYFPATSEGRAWEKRPREQQRAAMLWVLNQLFFTSFYGLPLGDRDVEVRRTLLIERCHQKTSPLERSGWSMHEIMDWLVEIKDNRAWCQKQEEF